MKTRDPELINQNNTTYKRLYYLDWLRVLAFGLLFLFHSWRPFDHFPWHIKNEEQTIVFDILTMFTHGWRMFLIFLVSGAGTWLAMRARKEAFMKDRIKRLLVPFVFGIFLIIPPQRFYEWIMFGGFEGDYLTFLLAYPTEQMGADMGASVLLWFGHLGTHIWYLPFLFVMTLLSLPLLKAIRKGNLRFDWLKRIASTRSGIFILIIPMILFRIALKPIFTEYTDWADFFVYLWPFLYGFIFMADQDFLLIVKKRMWLFLNAGVLSSSVFMYMSSLGEEYIQAYMSPVFNWLHVSTSIIAMFIAFSWIMFFLALFARSMNFNHKLLVPANISILPIYVLHQTLIIVFGYYIVGTELNPGLKFLAIAFTAIPVSLLLYKLIQTNNLTRFLFGLKPKVPTKKTSGKVENLTGKTEVV